MCPPDTLPELTSSCSRVSSVWTNTASKLEVPDLPNLLSAKRDDWLHWLDRCGGAEGETLKQSCSDNQPRVINIDDDDDDTMLRVGDWGGLADPHEHQIRHVQLAQIRGDTDYGYSDRVCRYCSYF